MNPSHVFFDFAGTLVDGVPSWEWPQIAACADVGLEVATSDVKKAIWRVWGPLEGCAHAVASADEAQYGDWIDRVEGQILRELGVNDSELARAIRRVTALQVDAGCYKLFPDTVQTLQELRQRGVRTAIVSNFAWHLPRLVADLGLGPYVDDVVTSARVGCRKPRPEIFHHAMTRLGANAGSPFVGDDLTCDIDGARGAGMRGILVDRAGRYPRQADRVASLGEVVELIFQSRVDAFGPG